MSEHLLGFPLSTRVKQWSQRERQQSRLNLPRPFIRNLIGENLNRAHILPKLPFG